MELENLPAQIDALEKEQTQISEQLAKPDLYKTDPELAIALTTKSSAIENQLQMMMTRWEQLLSKDPN
jgi:ATP-binding cassette subfamily F protein uup